MKYRFNFPKSYQQSNINSFMDTRQFYHTNDVNSPTVVPFSPVLPQDINKEGSMWGSFQREEKSNQEVGPMNHSAAENSRNFDGMMTQGLHGLRHEEYEYQMLNQSSSAGITEAAGTFRVGESSTQNVSPEKR